jgi:hypothetical protein
MRAETAYSEYYLPEVEKWLGRDLTVEEEDAILPLYAAGWHPRRVAEDYFHVETLDKE